MYLIGHDVYLLQMLTRIVKIVELHSQKLISLPYLEIFTISRPLPPKKKVSNEKFKPRKRSVFCVMQHSSCSSELDLCTHVVPLRVRLELM